MESVHRAFAAFFQGLDPTASEWYSLRYIEPNVDSLANLLSIDNELLVTLLFHAGFAPRSLILDSTTILQPLLNISII